MREAKVPITSRAECRTAYATIGRGATGFPGVYTRLSNRGVGNFILSVTGGAGDLRPGA
jgi:hypothetical protein